MDEKSSYPRWYIGLRGFVIGTAFGAQIMLWLSGGRFLQASSLWTQLVLPHMILIGCLVLFATVELGLGIRRYRVVNRTIRSKTSAQVQ